MGRLAPRPLYTTPAPGLQPALRGTYVHRSLTYARGSPCARWETLGTRILPIRPHTPQPRIEPYPELCMVVCQWNRTIPGCATHLSPRTSKKKKKKNKLLIKKDIGESHIALLREKFRIWPQTENRVAVRNAKKPPPRNPKGRLSRAERIDQGRFLRRCETTKPISSTLR